jgi:hypothetical protein
MIMKKAIMLFIAICFCTMSIFASEIKMSQVASVGECWNGNQAIVATMANGDKLYLGTITDDLTKARLSIALMSISQTINVYYKINTTSSICARNRYPVEWFSLNGSIEP